MVWALPPIAVTGEVIQASWGNNTRDSLNEAAAAKAVTSGRVFQATGTNALKEVGGMVLIAEVDLDSADGAISFTSIPSDHRHLKIIASLRSDNAGADTADITFNSDSANNYDDQLLRGDAATASASDNFGTDGIPIGLSGNSVAAGLFDGIEIHVFDYKHANKNKAVLMYSALKGGVTTGLLDVRVTAGFWRSNSAITQIDLTPQAGTNFKQYSQAQLYGLGV